MLQLLEDVREECAKFGTLEGMCAPRPPISISDSEGSRVFVKFSTHEEAKAVKNAFNGREFDGMRSSRCLWPLMLVSGSEHVCSHLQC